MAKSIIVYGRDLKQMRKYAERITKHLGMRLCVGWGTGRSSFKIPAQDTVVFFEWALSEVPQITNGHKAISFEEVAKQINDAIPLTDYFSHGIMPHHVGEYIASYHGDTVARRWWNGSSWSACWYTNEDEGEQARCKATSGIDHSQITWRGLSEEPILVKP